jgi:hypothetical protein
MPHAAGRVDQSAIVHGIGSPKLPTSQDRREVAAPKVREPRPLSASNEARLGRSCGPRGAGGEAAASPSGGAGPQRGISA